MPSGLRKLARAFNLEAHVLPKVPYRQWVLTLPTEVPATAPARLDPRLELDWEPVDDGEVVIDVEAEPRGPP